MVTSSSEPSVSTCQIERGLYALRYTDSSSDPCPKVTLRPRSGSLDLVSAPGQDEAILSRPGQALVIVTSAPAVFDLVVTATGRNGGLDAKLALDLLDGGMRELTNPNAEQFHREHRVEPSQVGGETGLTVEAHVSRRGDLSVGADEWVAGPGVILPIEALSINVARRDVSVDIRVQTDRSGGRWSNWFQYGNLAGSRQRAESLTGIGLALRGDNSGSLMLSADVMHLGSGSQTREGREVEFVGADPIVGFRLRVIDDTRQSVGGPGSTAVGPRVFRARR